MKGGKAIKVTLLISPFSILGILAVIAFVLEPDANIESLIDPELRLDTYHRMWSKQESPNNYEVYEPLLKRRNFRSVHKEIQLVEIPQPGTPDSPLYLTLRDQSHSSRDYPTPPWSSWNDAKDFSNWKSWFIDSKNVVAAPTLASPTPDPIKVEYVISLHASDGTLLDEANPRPFRGNNLTEIGEVIYDINQDGWVERVTSHNIGFRDSEVGGTLVTIKRIDRNTELIFSVLINVENDESDPAFKEEWSYQCLDTNGDGKLEIQIGPGSINEIEPATTFSWNADKLAFESPDGPVGPHYRVIQSGSEWVEMWSVLQDLLDTGKLRYPLDRP